MTVLAVGSHWHGNPRIFVARAGTPNDMSTGVVAQRLALPRETPRCYSAPHTRRSES